MAARITPAQRAEREYERARIRFLNAHHCLVRASERPTTQQRADAAVRHYEAASEAIGAAAEEYRRTHGGLEPGGPLSVTEPPAELPTIGVLQC